MTTRAKQAFKTKQLILEAALDLFSKKGFDNVTIEEIVKKAGFSKGTFYVHFSTKYHIFIEKFKEIDNFYKEYIKSIPEHLTASEKLLRFYEAQMIYIRDVIGFDMIRTVYINALSQTIEEEHYLVDQSRVLYQIIRNFIEEGISSGEFKDTLSLEELFIHISRCMRGNIYDWIIYGEQMDLVSEMHRFTTHFLEGIKSSE